MSKVLCVTSRSLCREDFLIRLEKIARAGCAGILLREKDLSPREYGELAGRVLSLCRAHQVPCILHSHAEIAAELGAPALRLSGGAQQRMSALRATSARLSISHESGLALAFCVLE